MLLPQTLLYAVLAADRPPREPTIIEDAYGNRLFKVEDGPSRPGKKGKGKPRKNSSSPERQSRCPVGMVYISSGEYGHRRISAFCLDAREVTVAEFAKHVTAMENRSEVTKRSISELKRDLETVDWLPPEPSGSQQQQRSPHCTWKRAAHEPDLPINCVSYAEAEQYCVAHGKRLPGELEWHWAARGKKAGWSYPWGKGRPATEFVNMTGADAEARLSGVDARKPSPVGLYDMAGNVWEWVAGDPTATDYTARGGSFRARSMPEVRVTSEIKAGARTVRSDEVGFRCAGPVQTIERSP